MNQGQYWGMLKKDFPDEYEKQQNFYNRKHTCDCGTTLKVGSLRTHLETKKHQSYLEKNNIDDVSDYLKNKKYFWYPHQNQYNINSYK